MGFSGHNQSIIENSEVDVPSDVDFTEDITCHEATGSHEKLSGWQGCGISACIEPDYAIPPLLEFGHRSILLK